MKSNKINFSIFILSALFCLNEASGQWAFNGTHIFNTNGGFVGIGTNTPAKLLDALRNSTEPTIRIFNTGGTGGATFQMMDLASGADWKFKATTTGGFKIRDNANAMDVITIEPSSASNSLYIGAGGYISLGGNVPQTGIRLLVNETSDDGVAVYAKATSTEGSTYGIYGYVNSTSANAAGGRFLADNGLGTGAGVYARTDGLESSYGVAGHAYNSGVGIGAWSYSGNLIRAYDGDYPGGTVRFYVTQSGSVYADGGYNTFKKALIPGGKLEYRCFSAIESAENWIEDIGSGELVNGKAIVPIDPVFAIFVELENDYKVFLTPVSDDIVNLVVTFKNAESFGVKGVKADGRPATCTFDYRIVTKDNDRKTGRMEIVDIPETVIVPRTE